MVAKAQNQLIKKNVVLICLVSIFLSITWSNHQVRVRQFLFIVRFRLNFVTVTAHYPNPFQMTNQNPINNICCPPFLTSDHPYNVGITPPS
jgi:hypothetical protein